MRAARTRRVSPSTPASGRGRWSQARRSWADPSVGPRCRLWRRRRLRVVRTRRQVLERGRPARRDVADVPADLTGHVPAVRDRPRRAPYRGSPHAGSGSAGRPRLELEVVVEDPRHTSTTAAARATFCRRNVRLRSTQPNCSNGCGAVRVPGVEVEGPDCREEDVLGDRQRPDASRVARPAPGGRRPAARVPGTATSMSHSSGRPAPWGHRSARSRCAGSSSGWSGGLDRETPAAEREAVLVAAVLGQGAVPDAGGVDGVERRELRQGGRDLERDVAVAVRPSASRHRERHGAVLRGRRRPAQVEPVRCSQDGAPSTAHRYGGVPPKAASSLSTGTPTVPTRSCAVSTTRRREVRWRHGCSTRPRRPARS